MAHPQAINEVIDWLIDNPSVEIPNRMKTIMDLQSLRTAMREHDETYRDYAQMPTAKR